MIARKELGGIFKIVKCYGKKLPILEWARISHVSPFIICERIKDGVDVKRAIFHPVMKKHSNFGDMSCRRGIVALGRRDPALMHDIQFHGSHYDG